MTEMTPRDHALKVAVIEALGDTTARELAKARKAAEPVFAAIRRGGSPQQEILLPDGTRIGLISIKAGTSSITYEPADAALEWAYEHAPHTVEDYVTAAAFERPDVIDLIKDKFPELIRERVSNLADLEKQIRETGGYLIDPESGERTKVAEVEQHDPNGSFAFTGGASQARRDRIVGEWRAGRIPAAILGPLALPAPEVLAADAVVVPPADDGPAPQEPGTAAGEPASDAELARIEWKRWLAAPAAGASDIGRSLAEAAGWRLVSVLGHSGCDGWTYDRRTGLTCSCGAVLDEPEKAGAAS